MNFPQIKTRPHFQLLRDWCADVGDYSTTVRIFRASALIAVLTLLAKVLSAVKEVVSAAYFGVGDDLDTFNVAFTLASFVLFVIAGAFQVSLIPVYLSLKEKEGDEAAFRLFSNAMGVTFAGLLCLLLVCTLILPSGLRLLLSGFNPVKITATLTTFFLLTPLVMIGGISLIFTAVLNAERRFTFAALSPALTSLTIVGALFLFARPYRSYALPIGVVAGSLLEFALLFYALKRSRIRLRVRFDVSDPEVRRMAVSALPIIIASLAANLVPFIEQVYASRLRSGDVSALGFGYKSVSIWLSLFSIAVGTSVLPYLSQLASREEWKQLRSTVVSTIFGVVLPLTVFVALILAWFSVPVVRILFQRGHFSKEATMAVASIQAMYCLQLPFYAAGIVASRVLTAIGFGRGIIVGSVALLASSVISNQLIVPHLGVRGVALSSAIGYLFCASSMLVLIFWKLRTKLVCNAAFI